MTFSPRPVCDCGAYMRVAYRRLNDAGQSTVRFKCRICKAGRTLILPDPDPDRVPPHVLAAIRPVLVAADMALADPSGTNIPRLRKMIAAMLAHPALP